MAMLALLSLALLAGSAYSAPQASRIVGGTETSIDKFPDIVQVEFLGVFSGNWGQSCAGTILTRYYILSAAHCFDGLLFNIENRRVRAGSTFRNTGGIIANAAAAYNHPSYGLNGFDADITVVRLLNPLEYSPVVQQGTIPPQGFQMPDNYPVVHAGWGAVSQGGPASEVLLETTIYTVNNEICANRYVTLPNPGIVTPNMICAGLLDVGGRDACQGDSGGPLYVLNENDGDIIIGVVSWGHGCANATFPGVSTAVSSYTDWIVATAL